MTKEQIDEFIHQIYPHLKDLEHGMVSADYVESKILTALSGVGEEEKECEHPEVIQIVRSYQCTSCNKIILTTKNPE